MNVLMKELSTRGVETHGRKVNVTQVELMTAGQQFIEEETAQRQDLRKRHTKVRKSSK